MTTQSVLTSPVLQYNSPRVYSPTPAVTESEPCDAPPLGEKNASSVEEAPPLEEPEKNASSVEVLSRAATELDDLEQVAYHLHCLKCSVFGTQVSQLVKRLYTEADCDGDGYVNLEELTQLHTRLAHEVASQDHVSALVEVSSVEVQWSGELSVALIALRGLQVSEAMKRFDADQDGQIDFAEFVTMLQFGPWFAAPLACVVLFLLAHSCCHLRCHL